jgi:hypothetical protein
MLDSAVTTASVSQGGLASGKLRHPQAPEVTSGWSNRIVVAALVGILFLTLYPFYFDLSRHLPHNRFPPALGGWGKPSGPLDVFLNIMLFMPLGFGLGEKLRERNRSALATFALSVFAGALLSYIVEVLQIFIPPRDSGWEDVINNSLGCGLGSLLFVICGAPVIALFATVERAFDSRPKPGWAVLIVAVYFALWVPIGISLQKETVLSGWNPESKIMIGNRANGSNRTTWRGKVLALQFWDRSVPASLAGDLDAGRSAPSNPAPVASYIFSGELPVQDRTGDLPDLLPSPNMRPASDHGAGDSNGSMWLISQQPASALVERLEASRQFSVRVVCNAALTDAPESIILSIAPSSGPADLSLGQDGSSLFFWFRTPLLAKKRYLGIAVQKVFAAGETRDVLISYDGAKVIVYVDGRPELRSYRLSAGVALAQFVRRVKPMELEGYRYIFYAVVFLPAGFLLGLAWRALKEPRLGRFLVLCFFFLIPCGLLEALLAHVSERHFSKSGIALSVLFLAAGCFWINADRGVLNPRRSEWIERTS